MDKILNRRLQAFSRDGRHAGLGGIRRGIEKESLRITPDGKLAQTPHPSALGSALTHPFITTDFSEALLEFITPPCDSIHAALGWLEDIHRFTCQQLHNQGELLWAASMPCILGNDADIPVGQYGSSNVAQMKTIYRVGLGHRYGRLMQTISGIHYNFSLPEMFWQAYAEVEGYASSLPLQDFITARYFDLIRNFRRHVWLLIYLFGAAPAVCPTFVRGREHHLQRLEPGSLYLPYATSLRMGNLGYQSSAQSELVIDYNNLNGYVQTLLKGLMTPHPPYEAIGLKGEEGWRQLSTSILQIENEFYSTIRPKRVTESGETPIHALHQRGVEYIEVRCVDVNPFQPLGIDSEQAHFIEVFLLHCLFSDSPSTDADEYCALYGNQHAVVDRGRDPSLKLFCHGGFHALRDWGSKLIEEMLPVARLLDEAMACDTYSRAVVNQRDVIAGNRLAPAAEMLEKMQKQNISFYQLARSQSDQHHAYFQGELPADRREQFEAVARQSRLDQQTREQQDKESFEAYLQDYYRQYSALLQ
ncbi:MAG: glutamate--cysteine ligase [Pseudomonadales bacterium]|nr:glutamate--cysteine ligase [Pseudomonadales bacterium]